MEFAIQGLEADFANESPIARLEVESKHVVEELLRTPTSLVDRQAEGCEGLESSLRVEATCLEAVGGKCDSIRVRRYGVLGLSEDPVGGRQGIVGARIVWPQAQRALASLYGFVVLPILKVKIAGLVEIGPLIRMLCKRQLEIGDALRSAGGDLHRGAHVASSLSDEGDSRVRRDVTAPSQLACA